MNIMNREDIINILKKYEDELGSILGRFERSFNSFHIDQDDDPRFRLLVIELRDPDVIRFQLNAYDLLSILHTLPCYSL